MKKIYIVYTEMHGLHLSRMSEIVPTFSKAEAEKLFSKSVENAKDYMRSSMLMNGIRPDKIVTSFDLPTNYEATYNEGEDFVQVALYTKQVKM